MEEHARMVDLNLDFLAELPLPEPMPSKGFYDLERDLCLSMDERKAANYELFKRFSRNSSEINFLPVKLDIEPVSRCIFRCTMCQVSDWPKMTRSSDMSLDSFKKLIEEQYGLVEIKLQGMGEPLLNAKDFFEMIRFARERHIWVRTVTNGSLLHINENYRYLVDSGVNEIQISIDGCTKEVFESIRRGSVFEKVRSNCAEINAYCDSLNLEKTKMWTVVQKNNFHQLRQFVSLAHELGFKSMVFALTLADWGQMKWREFNNSVTVDAGFNKELTTDLINLGTELGVKVAFWVTTSKFSSNSTKTLCPWPFERAYVSSDSRIVPCCMIGNPDVYELTHSAGFTETWFSREYKEFREAHLRGDIPNVCKSCYYNPE